MIATITLSIGVEAVRRFLGKNNAQVLPLPAGPGEAIIVIVVHV